LFNAETEEELLKIEALGVTIMEQAIGAYRHIAATDEFKEIERLRSRARHNEASALGHARREGYREADEKWQGIVADKDMALANKEMEIANKEMEIEKLRKQLAELQTESDDKH